MTMQSLPESIKTGPTWQCVSLSHWTHSPDRRTNPFKMNSIKLIAVLGAVFCLYAGHVLAQTTEGYPVECGEDDEFIPHQNCSLYWQCSNGIPFLQECPGNLYFSPETKNCEAPTDVPECVGGTRPPDGTTTTTAPTTTTTTTSTTTTTTEPTMTTTTGSTTTTTGTTTTTTSTTTEPPPTEGPFECPPTGVHDFPFPGNCSLYYRCISGTPFVQECAEGLLFDRVDLVCKPAADAVCEDDDMPTTTSDPPEFDCPPSGFDTFPHASNCSRYYLCFDGSLFIESCAFGTYYDASPAVKQCNLAETALCDSECPAEGIHYLPVRTSKCDYYKVCFNSNSVNLHCADGTVYHPVEQRCVHIDAYTCPYAGFDSLLAQWGF